MLKSMTGYGKSVCEIESKKITVEIRSLNSKQLDLNTKVPFIYREKELSIRNTIANLLKRGKIDFSLSIETSVGEKTPIINQEVVLSYYNQIQEIVKTHHLNNSTDWLQTIMRLPDTLTAPVQELDEAEWQCAENTIKQALNDLDKYRSNEGRQLEQDILNRVSIIENQTNNILTHEKERIETIRNRILTNINEKKLGENLDKNRFEEELIYYIEKIDFTEEKVRLLNHCQYFRDTIKEPECGKKLTFITQEMGREINTLGSKAYHSEIQKHVVIMKDELEKIKEQLSNIL